ncbi:uncharacterized protein LOC126678317 [Mercurialis annua]|uniref:uncharacterized protein LOC126678317 n=1 Tax=Mercurialis annua TaxID=3986 RepID=UPI002160B6F9|nr:uncharacterized protein LOC126678317 [Mercurialis annua]
MWIKENVENVVWPAKMMAEIRDIRKFCKSHNEHGHKTDECGDLKVEIERMIDAGELRKFIAHKTKSSDKGEKRSRDDKGKEKEEERPSKILGTMHMINGEGHINSTIRRKQRREVMNIRETHMPRMIFDVEDYEHVKAPYNDALVVTTIIENWNMERILINKGSVVNLYDKHCIQNVRRDHNKVEPSLDSIIRTRRAFYQPARRCVC